MSRTYKPGDEIMKIALLNTYRVIQGRGGAEKVFCELANGFAQCGHEVLALAYDEAEEALQKTLFPSRIKQNCSVRFFFTTSKNGVFFAIKIV